MSFDSYNSRDGASGNPPVSETFRTVFRSTTGLPVNFVSNEEIDSAGVEPETAFCRAAQQFPEAREACRKCRRDLLKQAQTNAVTVTCWAGFAETAVPVKLRGRHSGFIVTGQVPLSPLGRRNLPRRGEAFSNAPDDWRKLEALYQDAKSVEWKDYRERIRLLEVFRDQLVAHPTSAAEETGGMRNTQPIRIRRLCAAIEKEFADEWSIPRAAKVACMSVFHFCRLFKKATGKTFNEYLTQIRVSRAKERLASGCETVTEIALSIGFQSISQFNRQFKTLTGATPSQFREMLSKNAAARLA